MYKNLRSIFCLIGPTAAGKTALAMQLATRFPFEIISVDSAMIYKGLDIGTAKPSPLELAKTPHHLIDIINPPESFSAAEFCQQVQQLNTAILARGNIPLLVGGTMMYFKALQQGLASLPSSDDACRDALTAQASKLGWGKMHAELTKVDSQSAAKIHPNDSQRIQRALEVYYLTGKPLSKFLEEQTQRTDYSYINLLLVPENRSWLHERIAVRFNEMLKRGFVHEVAKLLEDWQLPLNCPAMRTVGYRQAGNYLIGNDSYEEFCYKAIAATRQLAKRQLTWLRHWPEGFLFACDNEESSSKIMAAIDTNLTCDPYDSK